MLLSQIGRFALIILTGFFLACTQHSTEPDMITNPNAGASKYTFLSLGDSYTIGESVSESDRWSVQLANLLRKDSIDTANPDVIARTGWTTSQLQNAIIASGNQKTYNLVSLLIGVNNQYQGLSQATFRTEFSQLLQTTTKFAGNKVNHVLVLSIPDWGASPYGARSDRAKITQEINQFNTIVKDECQKAGIAFVDITPLTRSANGDASQFADDGLHYSGKQMQLWAQKALPVAKALLAN